MPESLRNPLIRWDVEKAVAMLEGHYRCDSHSSFFVFASKMKLCGGGLQRPTCLSCSRILSLKRTGTFGFECLAPNDYVRCYLEAVHVASWITDITDVSCTMVNWVKCFCVNNCRFISSGSTRRCQWFLPLSVGPAYPGVSQWPFHNHASLELVGGLPWDGQTWSPEAQVAKLYATPRSIVTE